MVHHLMVRYIVSIRHFLTLYSVKKAHFDCVITGLGAMTATGTDRVLLRRAVTPAARGLFWGLGLAGEVRAYSSVRTAFLMVSTHIRECF